LGVEGNELRIADNTGIVGQVVHTGDVRRVDHLTGDDEISRDVDNQLGFRTRSLLCVPLRDRKGEVLGAFEMINKIDGNFTPDDEAGLVELAAHASIALQNTQQFQQLLESRKQLAQQAADGVQLIGETPPMQKLRRTVERVANTDLAILVLGENGTGKEVVSQMIHYLSERRDEPFVAVNCAAMTETLLESELFGHEKGAFTDAHESRAGKFELASGGTLFLDEIGDLSLGGQAKLLRVLEEKVVVRVGGSLPIKTDSRVLAATNQDLAEMVRERRFREDLFFRLNVVTIEMPPLRERIDDILLLAEHFLKGFCIRARRAPPKFTPEAVKRLRQHTWPGNVRELRNLMERLAYLSQGDAIDVDDLAFIMSTKGDASANISLELSLTDATKHFQADFIRKHIEICGGNMSEAAKKLGLHRSNLYRKMRQLDMSDAEDDPHLS
jgi:Nif-specific regulatory protein